MRSDIPKKLQRLAEQIRETGYARAIRLTVIQERLFHDELLYRPISTCRNNRR